MSPHKYKGCAEPIRLLFYALDIPFEDNRIPLERWSEYERDIPTHQPPYLEVVDNIGKTVIHSEIMAIARLIARQHRMMGQSDEDYYRVERIIGQCMDLVEHRGKIHHAGGEEREKLITEFKAEIAPRLLESICRSLKESDGLFVTGNTPSLGDLGILTALDQVAEIDHNMSQCQFLNEHRAAVLKKFPKLAEYVRNRPITTVWSA